MRARRRSIRARDDAAHARALRAHERDARVHVGLGDQPRITRIVVQWPDGVTESFDGVAADRITTLRRGAGRTEAGGR